MHPKAHLAKAAGSCILDSLHITLANANHIEIVSLGNNDSCPWTQVWGWPSIYKNLFVRNARSGHHLVLADPLGRLSSVDKLISHLPKPEVLECVPSTSQA